MVDGTASLNTESNKHHVLSSRCQCYGIFYQLLKHFKCNSDVFVPGILLLGSPLLATGYIYPNANEVAMLGRHSLFHLTLDLQTRMHIRLGAAVLGLVATGCDIVITMRGEMRYIWKKPLRTTFVRCLFVWMRYLPIALHIINIVLTRLWLDDAQQVSEHRCRILMIFQLLTFTIMLMLLELVLVLRVYALYDRSRACL
ncbi:hypothetical protein BDP27DRAFT_824514 [Rhodocollybia butyracea]|uniref:DUF6533 domain-containing protein n=1 Tax=Rhodocollybia butyracea TaxID=206335 RepID=A0A9P5U731_9AGAR|nr:hypothetical protein BDP27DRAFT_824514 [Rhodocollybia butyracea]